MKTREFIIDREEFDLDYQSSLTAGLIEEYLLQDLEIPQEYIKSLKISDEYVNIELANSRKYFNDDWYVNLQRAG